MGAVVADGVVDQNLNGTESIRCLRDHPSYLLPVGDVGMQSHGVGTGGSDLVNDPFGVVFAAVIVHDHPSAVERKQLRCGLSYPPAGAGNENDLLLKAPVESGALHFEQGRHLRRRWIEECRYLTGQHRVMLLPATFGDANTCSDDPRSTGHMRYDTFQPQSAVQLDRLRQSDRELEKRCRMTGQPHADQSRQQGNGQQIGVIEHMRVSALNQHSLVYQALCGQRVQGLNSAIRNAELDDLRTPAGDIGGGQSQPFQRSRNESGGLAAHARSLGPRFACPVGNSNRSLGDRRLAGQTMNLVVEHELVIRPRVSRKRQA